MKVPWKILTLSDQKAKIKTLCTANPVTLGLSLVSPSVFSLQPKMLPGAGSLHVCGMRSRWIQWTAHSVAHMFRFKKVMVYIVAPPQGRGFWCSVSRSASQQEEKRWEKGQDILLTLSGHIMMLKETKCSLVRLKLGICHSLHLKKFNLESK